MTINTPPFLKPGDTIAITAPSSGVPLPLQSQLDQAISYLQSRGYQTIEGHYLRDEQKNQSAPKYQRAAELTQFLLDPNINAIIPPWGGERASDLLDLIDFNSLRDQPAKWFCGYSDISTLQVPLTTLSGWATVHGPCLMDFGTREIDSITEGLWPILEGAQQPAYRQYSSDLYHDQHTNSFESNENGHLFNIPTQWKLLNQNLSHISFSGYLIGGCLDTLSYLIGTPYGDITQFCLKHKASGTILFFENAELSPCQMLRALLCMKRNGWFENLAGIVIGRNSAQDATFKNQLSYLDALKEAFDGVNCPILFDADIGHKPPQLSLVNGVYCEVEYHLTKTILTQYI